MARLTINSKLHVRIMLLYLLLLFLSILLFGCLANKIEPVMDIDPLIIDGAVVNDSLSQDTVAK